MFPASLFERCVQFSHAAVGVGAGWLLQSAVLIAIGLVAGRALRAKGAAVQSVVYRATLAATLACPIVSLLLAASGVPGLHLAGVATSSPAPSTDAATAMPIVSAGDRPVASPSPYSEPGGMISRRVAAGEHVPHAQAWLPTAPPREAMPPDVSLDWSAILVCVVTAAWLLGSGVLLVRVLSSWRLTRQLLRTAHPADLQTSSDCLAIARQFRVFTPAVLRSPFVSSPSLVGVFRPAILLPEEEPPETADRAILVHELAHLARGDVLWSLASRIATAVLCYQPLVWLLARRIVVAAEEVCDDYVVQLGFDRPGYARRLVDVAERYQPAPAIGVGVISLRSCVGRRVVRILDSSRQLSTRAGRRVGICTAAAFIVATFMVGLVGIGGSPAGAAPGDDARPPAADSRATQPKAEGVVAVEGQVVAPAGSPIGKASPQAAAGESEPGESLAYAGTVTDRLTDKPIAGATVTVRRAVHSYSNTQAELRTIQETKHLTDAQGRYTFTIPPEQVAEPQLCLQFDASHPGYVAKAGFGYGFESLATIRRIEKLGGRKSFGNIRLVQSEEVTGTVLTPEGKPAAGVVVAGFSRLNRQDREADTHSETKADSQGRFRLDVVKGGEAVLWPAPDDYATCSRFIGTKRGDQGRIVLERGVTLQGRVVDEHGKPVPDVWVNARPRAVPDNGEYPWARVSEARCASLTDPQGQFRMSPLPPGQYSVGVEDRPSDNPNRSRCWTRRAPPAVFTGQTIELKQDGTAQSIEIRAVPHVVIEMQCKTSAGKAWNGRQVGVRVVGTSARGWFTVSAAPDANRKIVVKVPERAHCLPMDLFTNEFTSLRWRRSGGRLDNSLRVELGAIDADERGYEIICYEAPVALVKPVAEDGTPVTGSTVKADYSEGYGPNLNKYVVRGDVRFDKQDDGRWRSISLLPDEQFMVFVNADGFKPKSEKVMLPEGAVKEIEVKLQRE